jgi:uncharacterized protein (DUF362 family)
MFENRVAIVKGTKPKLMVYKALKMLKWGKELSKDDHVLIKPNCVFPSVEATTDSRVVEAVIEFLKKNGVENIKIGEGGNPDVERTFTLTGLRDIAHRHSIKLVNFNIDKSVKVDIPFGKALLKVRISKTALDSTCIINIPTLKIHHMTQVTLSIKNLMGVIVGSRGGIMHKQIDNKLVDLASLIRPKINIIDGILGSEMDEVFGRSVKMGVIIAGTNIVATDSVGSSVMNVDPSSVKHLKLSEERGLGPTNTDKILVLGESIKSVMKRFKRRYSEKRLKWYGYNHDVGDEILRPIWENLGSK